ncbi:MAG: type II toxin-antitoxin system VapC family toxin [Lautropia sp.]|nr:type II toxin-antitoxin system VapC family toxin [Lautropia sp.]
MFLIDTNVISEARKGKAANGGVSVFLREADRNGKALYLSAITIGELQRGVRLIRHRGDLDQAERLERWLMQLIQAYQDRILPVDSEVAMLWGALRVPHPENALDKLIAATACLNGLTLVTRNIRDFSETGVPLLNPFS